MTTKFKKGDHVYLKTYPCLFKIKETVELSDGQFAYRLSLISSAPRELKWLPLILRMKLAVDTELLPTYQQKQRNRTNKLKQLLK